MAGSEPTSSKAVTPRYGRHGPRSKNGCNTCRTRKVKCDETRDVCNRCAKAQIPCIWDRPTRSRRLTTEGHQQSSMSSPQSSRFAAKAVSDPAASAATPPAMTPSAISTSAAVTNGSPASFHSLSLSSRAEAASPHLTSPPDNLHLSPEDLESFEYIPRSFMVLRFGKPWRWSMISYVHSTIARREKGVMRAFIAVASMELRSRELSKVADASLSPQSTEKAQTFRKNASNSLHLAMQDLSSLLNRVAFEPNNPEMLEALFAMWFLILHFGIYDSHLVDMSYMHLDGIRSFVSEYFHGHESHRIHKLPPASKQLLVYICYLDIMLALGSMSGGRLSLDLMSAPSESPVHYTRLFEEARVCVPQLWGVAYPAEELLDDVENYRPLKFLNICQMLKLRVWETGVTARKVGITREDLDSLWERIEGLEQDYCDILLLAKQVTSTGGRRVIWTIYHAALDFHALIILYSCIHTPDSVPVWLDGNLAELLGIAHKALREDPEHVYRYAWALHMAFFKVRDPIHRDWLQLQIRKASLLLSNLGIPSRPLEGVSVHDMLFVEQSTA